MSELRSELWEKEMKLTDIRLEALNSAHQLDQLRETMHNMQVSPRRGRGAAGRGCREGAGRGSWTGRGRGTWRPRLQTPAFLPQLEVDLLKAENDRLKVAPGPSASSAPGQAPGSSALPSPRRSLGLALTHPFSPSLADTGTCWGEGPGRVERRKGFAPARSGAASLGQGCTSAAAKPMLVS